MISRIHGTQTIRSSTGDLMKTSTTMSTTAVILSSIFYSLPELTTNRRVMTRHHWGLAANYE